MHWAPAPQDSKPAASRDTTVLLTRAMQFADSSSQRLHTHT